MEIIMLLQTNEAFDKLNSFMSCEIFASFININNELEKFAKTTGNDDKPLDFTISKIIQDVLDDIAIEELNDYIEEKEDLIREYFAVYFKASGGVIYDYEVYKESGLEVFVQFENVDKKLHEPIERMIFIIYCYLSAMFLINYLNLVPGYKESH